MTTQRPRPTEGFHGDPTEIPFAILGDMASVLEWHEWLEKKDAPGYNPGAREAGVQPWRERSWGATLAREKLGYNPGAREEDPGASGEGRPES